MSSPWLTDGAVSPRLLIERAHDEFLAGNASDPRLRHVRSIVRESWLRSLANMVGAESLPALELPAETLDAYREAHPLAGAMELIRRLLHPEEDAGIIIAVGDAAGRLLWIEGDTTIRARVADMGFSEGANWSEDHVGTAAPGTALALGRSVQVRGAEHFNRFVQRWSCTAAPVRDLETGSLIGVIDVTGGETAASAPARLLVDATARAVEGELLAARLRARAETAASRHDAAARAIRRRAPDERRPSQRIASPHATLGVLGRDEAVLTLADEHGEHALELGLRHAEILLMLAVHRHGLTAERLAELVYGSADAIGTLRPEIVRLRKRIERTIPDLVPQSRPYRSPVELESDAQHVISLLDRGAHRVALSAYVGEVLPGSASPGVEEVRETVRTAMRETMLTGAGADVLLSYLETDLGAEDTEAMHQALRLLPARSPRRAGIVARLERLR